MRRIALTLLLLAVAALAAQAQVYKWVDKDGRVHYGEKPPDDVKASEVNVKTTPSAAPAETSQTWKEKDAEFQRRKIEREQKEQASEGQRQQQADARRRQCLRARDDLDTLTAGVPVYRVNEKGERVYMDDAARPARIAEAKKRIEDNCSP